MLSRQSVTWRYKDTVQAWITPMYIRTCLHGFIGRSSVVLRWFDRRTTRTHTWRVTITAKPVVCYRGNFVHPTVCETYYWGWKESMFKTHRVYLIIHSSSPVIHREPFFLIGMYESLSLRPKPSFGSKNRSFQRVEQLGVLEARREQDANSLVPMYAE